MDYLSPQDGKWIDILFRMIHITTRCYDPSVKYYMRYFIESIPHLSPSGLFKNAMSDFIQMNKDVVEVITTSDTGRSFFIVYPKYLKSIQYNPQGFFEECLQTQDSLFVWSYLLSLYWFKLNRIKELQFSFVDSSCEKSTISKETWAHPTWYMIHFFAAHAPVPMTNTWTGYYNTFIMCLQFILPCPKCRAHLIENLKKHPLPQYNQTRNNIFEWAWELHNIVNHSLNKPLLSLNDAWKTYAPYKTMISKHNTIPGRFMHVS